MPETLTFKSISIRPTKSKYARVQVMQKVLLKHGGEVCDVTLSNFRRVNKP